MTLNFPNFTSGMMKNSAAKKEQKCLFLRREILQLKNYNKELDSKWVWNIFQKNFFRKKIFRKTIFRKTIFRKKSFRKKSFWKQIFLKKIYVRLEKIEKKRLMSEKLGKNVIFAIVRYRSVNKKLGLKINCI